ncbi:lipopolysaccharide export system protein LptA [Natronospira proteinivora]|uniref:Lipopolysaccharide export system protein LptA n=1 Tax=Natronospira proteinivora TaxID=1807133 RepID=A0ABT1G479_9GAMM|nr:lipopolysaccharide transport periplasmic protein LptA [Natronospira proteinivora]MCP1726076.1 lipopolysaccharide export system protein LptA [Natronospira proteinivora]
MINTLARRSPLGRRSTLLATLLCFTLLLAGPASAVEDLEIEADDFDGDGRAGVVTYRGNVVMRHQEMTIHADRMRFHQTPDGDPERAEFDGEPVRLRVIHESGPDTRGQARQIHYRFDTEHLQLIDEAELQQGRQLISAAHIDYNMPTEQVRAQRGEDEESRVRTRFQQNGEEENGGD